MHTIPCTSCGHIVEVESGAAICSTCGKDLTAQIPGEGTSQYYYTRAELLLEQQNFAGALDVVREGLRDAASSDLLLLAALLAERLGKFDLMRHSVAQIPLNDVLREEGEWLLRAHQTRQRAQRQGKDPAQAILEQFPAAPPVSEAPPLDAIKVLDQNPPVWRRIAGWAATLVLALGLIAAGLFYQAEILSMAQSLLPEGSGTTRSGAPVSTEQDVADPVASPAADSSRESDLENPTVPGDAPLATATQLPAAAPTAAQQDLQEENPPQEPNEAIPDDLTGGSEAAPQITVELEPVQEDSDRKGPQIADADPQNAAAIIIQEPFDILAIMREAGRSDLSALPIDGQLKDGRLTVFGQVRSFEQRTAVLEILQNLPNVTEINDIGLILRLPETYTVQEGDVLWAIALRLYGDAARWQQIYQLNESSLASPEALRVGQVLQLPSQ